MREVDNLDAGLGLALGATAYGLMNAAGGIGDAVGSAIRRAAYLRQVDTLTRVAVRANLAANRKRAASKAEADEILRELAIARVNARLLKKAA